MTVKYSNNIDIKNDLDKGSRIAQAQRKTVKKGMKDIKKFKKSNPC